MSTVVLLLSMTFLGGPPLEVQFEGTLDLFAPATQDIELLSVDDGAVEMFLPTMGFVDVTIIFARADANQDWVINVHDILAIISAWGFGGCPKDVDDSGSVDVGDILMVINAW